MHNTLSITYYLLVYLVSSKMSFDSKVKNKELHKQMLRLYKKH
jgi:hypothetical protein